MLPKTSEITPIGSLIKSSIDLPASSKASSISPIVALGFIVPGMGKSIPGIVKITPTVTQFLYHSSSGPPGSLHSGLNVG